MKVTIRDVAKEAGVSPSTVSRVLSNSQQISSETKERVREAVKKLNFKPNAIARSLANNKTHTLGIIMPSEIEDTFTNPFFIQAMQGISLYASQHQYYMMYTAAKNREEEVKCAKDFVMNGRVDGIIILKAESQDYTMELLEEMKFPFVVIGHPDNGEDILWVDNDNESATYQVVDELIKDGHKKIGFIGAKLDWAVSKDRLAGYKRAVRDNFMSYDETLVYHGVEFDERTGQAGVEALTKQGEVTAIVTTDDLIAVGASRYYNQKGQDPKVLTGFNNTMIGQYQHPPISSVDIQAVKLGWYASKLLIGKLEGKEQKKKHYIVETEFIKRN